MLKSGIVRTSVVVGLLVLLCASAGAQTQRAERVLEVFRPRAYIMEEIADALGVNVETLRDAIDPVANLTRLAEAQGVQMEELRQIIAKATKEARQERVQRGTPVPTIRSRHWVAGQRVPAFGVQPQVVQPKVVRPQVRPRRLGVAMRAWPATPYRSYGRGMGGPVIQAFPPVAVWNEAGQPLRPRIVWEPVEPGHSRPMFFHRGMYPASEEPEFRRFRQVPEVVEVPEESSESTQRPTTNE